LEGFESYPFRSKGGFYMAGTVTASLVQQFASMKPTEFGPAIEPKWQLAERLVKEVRSAVEKQQLTPLDGARVISSITATLFGYDEFILREVSPESLLASTPRR
jgi:hypothetical protein